MFLLVILFKPIFLSPKNIFLDFYYLQIPTRLILVLIGAFTLHRLQTKILNEMYGMPFKMVNKVSFDKRMLKAYTL